MPALFQATTELSILDQLYIVSFSIFYGVMLHALKGMHAFDTSAVFTGDAKPVARFAISVFFLNLLPFLYFSIVLLYFLQDLQVNIFTILVVFALSLSIFGFNKIFYSILVSGKSRLYTPSELESVTRFSGSIERKFSSHYLQFLIPGILYILVPIGMLALALDIPTGAAIIAASIGGSIAAWYRWRRSALTAKAVKKDASVDAPAPSEPTS